MTSTHENLLDELVAIVAKEGASDLHLAEGRPPIIRVSNFLIPLVKIKPLTKEDVEGFLSVLLKPFSRKEFDEKKDTNFSWSHGSKLRFRCNAYVTLGKTSVAMRLVPSTIKTFEELHLPLILEQFTRKQQGFFLVVGPVGVGKSTTLASMVESINKERLEHIITIEDPVEFIFEPKKSIIDQREVRLDTPGFHRALEGVFRQDVDIVMIGEMRDRETISTAVSAAETGHLVFSTLHTNNAAQTIDRIIDSFPSESQAQIRLQLSGSLVGIFSQRLVPKISGGLVPAYELLINNNAVANLIRDRRTHEIANLIETSGEEGMIDLNRSLAELVRRGEITAENAFHFSLNPKTLAHML